MNSKKTKGKKKGCIGGTLKIIISLSVIAVIVFALVKCINKDMINEKIDDLRKIQYPQKYSDYVDEYSELYGVDDSLVYAVIRTESHFNKDDTSGAGAMGLMQITPECFEFLQRIIPNDATKYSDEDLYNPQVNIKFGTYFLSYLLQKYNNVERTALAAYNAGFGTVDNWLSDPQCSNDGKNLDVILYPETDDYVDKVENAKKVYKELYE